MPVPFCDWSPPGEYALFPSAIGAAGVLFLPEQALRNTSAEIDKLRDGKEKSVGIDAAVKPYFSRSTTGEFGSPQMFTDAEKVTGMRMVSCSFLPSRAACRAKVVT
eukprot:1190481-Prorocentrum_minimum.AAC.2